MATRRPVKRTMRELANSIIAEGAVDKINNCITATFIYYRAFGQRWRLSFSRGGTLKSVEPVDENDIRIGF